MTERYVSIVNSPDNQFDLVNSELGRYYMGRFSKHMDLDEAAWHAARMVARRIDEALDLVTSPSVSAFTRALNAACDECNVPLLGVNISYDAYPPAVEHVVAGWHYNALLGEWACTSF